MGGLRVALFLCGEIAE